MPMFVYLLKKNIFFSSCVILVLPPFLGTNTVFSFQLQEHFQTPRGNTIHLYTENGFTIIVLFHCTRPSFIFVTVFRVVDVFNEPLHIRLSRRQDPIDQSDGQRTNTYRRQGIIK